MKDIDINVMLTQVAAGKASFPFWLEHFGITYQRLGETLGWPMPQHIVSVRHHLDHWPMKDHAAILYARSLYDAGKVEMVTGREDLTASMDIIGPAKSVFVFILYQIPRVRQARIRRYFSRFGNEVDAP